MQTLDKLSAPRKKKRGGQGAQELKIHFIQIKFLYKTDFGGFYESLEYHSKKKNFCIQDLNL